MNELMLEGLKLMLLGMGSVFIFLLMLVISMKLMSRLAQFLQPAEVAPAAIHSHPSTPQVPNLVAVISAAVAAYRNK
ncbi:MAG: OadG family protein [Gammaproteobacteria bacterium]|nr:OadG family protein [Gammaproteobacteria bacterium]